MFLFGFTKFFTRFFIACTIFKHTAVTWRATFQTHMPNMPDGIGDGGEYRNKNNRKLKHYLESLRNMSLLITCIR